MSIFIIIVIFILTTSLFNANFITIPSIVSQLVVSILLLVGLALGGRLRQKKMHFFNEVLLLTIIPFISSIPAYIINNQGFFSSIAVTLPILYILVYYIAHIYGIKSSKILKAFYYIALFIAFIQVLQQIFPSLACFGLSRIGNDLEIRNNLLRYRIGCHEFAILLAFFLWTQLLKKFTIRNCILFGIFLISIYLHLTRQLIFAVLVSLFFSFFYIRNIALTKKIIFIIISGLLLYSFREQLFGEFFIKTIESNDLTEDNIRVLSKNIFWEEIKTDFLTIFLGNGIPNYNTSFGHRIKAYEDIGVHLSDVGPIGIWWKFGIFYVITFYSIVLKVLIKYRKLISTHIKLFFITSTICSVMIFPIYQTYSMIFWGLLLYIIDQEINTNKQLL